MNGTTSHMSGHRYAGDRYGFPKRVMQFMRNWFDCEECSTPDIQGRKVFQLDNEGNKQHIIVRHMKAGDRDENHELFVKLTGKECLDLRR